MTRVIPEADSDGPYFYVFCPWCDTQGPITWSGNGAIATEHEAIAAWNRRAPIQNLTGVKA